MNRIGQILGVCAMIAFSGAAFAQAPHEKQNNPPLGGSNTYNCKEKECTHSHNIGEWHTFEFKGQCDGFQPKSQKCQSGNGNVTCTITENFANYDSCSCTNWDVVKKHKGKVTIDCPST
jgi:hypothetical protein